MQQRYHQLLGIAYSAAAANTPSTGETDIDQLMSELLPLTGHELAVATSNNMASLKANSHHHEFQLLFARLLKEDALFAASQLYDAAAQTGDPYLNSKLNYEFARYYLSRASYAIGESYLQKVKVKNAMTLHERDYASIMQGIVLQHQGRHRAAIPFYESIEQQSPHFSVAQLNLATVYIRQDWWTDAHLAIDKAIAAASEKEFIDRLHTLLGFSQLQREFYRDSRNSFRKVRTASSYRHRAFFGLGLAALHQEDYAAALNVFNNLKKTPGYHQSKSESYLLVATTLERMNEPGAASASYNEAIAYYDMLAARLKSHNNRLKTGRNREVADQTKQFLPQLQTVDRIDEQLDRLTLLKSLKGSGTLVSEIQALSQELQALRLDLMLEQLETLEAAVEHYQSQARFGLARLHDAAH